MKPLGAAGTGWRYSPPPGPRGLYHKLEVLKVNGSDLVDEVPFSRRWVALDAAGGELTRVCALDEDEAWLLVEQELCLAGRADFLLSWWAGGERLEEVLR